MLRLPRKKAVKAIKAVTGHDRSEDMIKTGSGATYAIGQKVIGNVPGNQGIRTEDQIPFQLRKGGEK